MASITLKNANINSGTAVIISGHVQSYAFKRLITGTPSPGYYDSSNTNYWQIPTQHRGGVEAPLIVINGNFSINDAFGSNEMNEQLLRYFWRERQNSCYLKLIVGNNDYQVRDYKGNQETDGIKCEVVNVTQNFDTSSEYDHLFRYTITLRETQ